MEMNITVATGFKCITNPCDCTLAIVGAEEYKCDANGDYSCQGCAFDEKCVTDPVNCVGRCAKTNAAPCSEAACKQAGCADYEECVTDFYKDKCHSRCQNKTVCATCTDSCDLSCGDPLKNRCAFTCECDKFCETCSRSKCATYSNECGSGCGRNQECVEDICNCRSYCRACDRGECSTFDEQCSVSNPCPFNERCVEDNCECKADCEACLPSECSQYSPDECTSDSNCLYNEKCVYDYCSCKRTCEACDGSQCTSGYTNTCGANGCGDDRSCDRNNCTCKDECRTCNADRCTSLNKTYEFEDCPGGCQSNFECKKDPCGCKDECAACSCSNYTDNCGSSCGNINGQPSKCLNDPDLCKCEKSCQVCTLDQCDNNQLDKKCNVDSDCNLSNGEICQENLCGCEQVCFDCCGDRKNRNPCGNNCNDCRPTDQGDYCTSCLFKCYDTAEYQVPPCEKGNGDIDGACGRVTTNIFCRTNACQRVQGVDDCCNNFSFCNPDESIFKFVYDDKLSPSCRAYPSS